MHASFIGSHASFISMHASFIGSHALKGQKLLAQGIALGIMAISNAPCKGKSFVIIWFFEAFALTGRQVCKHIYPGRCPGLGASALSGRIGSDMTHLPRSFCPCRPDGFEIRPPADIHLHNKCWASAYQLLCKRTTPVVRLKT